MPVRLLSRIIGSNETRYELDTEHGRHRPSGSGIERPKIAWTRRPFPMVGTRGPMPAAGDSSIQDGEGHCNVHNDDSTSKTRGMKRQGKNGKIRVARTSTLVCRPGFPEGPKVALGMPVLCCRERAGNRIRQRSATICHEQVLRPA